MRLCSTSGVVIYIFHLTVYIMNFSMLLNIPLDVYNLFNKPPTVGHLNCYKFLTIINKIEIKDFIKIYVFIHDDLLRIYSNK